jgi:hypothetical protein
MFNIEQSKSTRKLIRDGVKQSMHATTYHSNQIAAIAELLNLRDRHPIVAKTAWEIKNPKKSPDEELIEQKRRLEIARKNLKRNVLIERQHRWGGI